MAAQPNLSANASINNLLFSTAGSNGYDITSSSSLIKLTLLSITATGGSSGTAAITGVATGTNTIDAPIVLGAAAAATQTFFNAGTLVFNGVISSTNSITLSLGTSAGTYVFNGANTLTGTVKQNAGNTIIVGNKAAFGTATVQLNGSGGQIQAGTDLTGANKIANNLLFSTPAETISNSGSNGIEFGGTVDLGGGALTLTSAISGGATFDGVMSNDLGGGLSIVTTNSSLVTLKGTSIYTGATTISGTGKVSVSSIGNSGVSGNLGQGTTIKLGSVASAGTLVYTGTGETSTKIIDLSGTTGGATIDQSGTGLLKFSGTNTSTGAGAHTLTLQGSTAGNGEISGAIVNGAGTTSLLKAGTNTWTLSGTNTYTGSTTVNQGTLALNFDTATAPATNIISSSSALVMGGGTFNVTGKSATATSQTMNGLTLNSGGSTIAVFQAATPNAVVLNLGSITHSAAGTVNFNLPPGGQNSGYGITTTTANTNGILGGWATANTNDWAANSGNNIVTLPSYFVFDNVSGWSGAGAGSGSNMTDNNGYDATFTNSITLNSLRFNASGSDSNVGVVNTQNLTLNSGGILVTNNVGAKFQRIGFLNTSFTLGQGQGGLTASGNSSELFINQNNSGTGHLEIYANIFGTGVSLVKSGPGFLDLRGLAATYTGATTINGGTLQLSGGNDRLPTGTSVTMNAGTLTLSGVDQTIAGLSGSSLATVDHAGAGTNILTVNLPTANSTNTYSGVIKNSAGTLNLVKGGLATTTLVLAGANTYSGETDINAGTLQINVSPGTTTSTFFVGNGGTTTTAASLILGGTGGVTFGNTVNVNAGDVVTNRTIGGTNSGTNSFTGPIILSGPVNLTETTTAGTVNFSGVISGVGQGITKLGAGTVTLNGASANTFSGATVVSAGTLNPATAGALGSTSSVTVNTGGTLLLTGSGNLDRINNAAGITLSGGTFGRSGTGTVSEGVGSTRNGAVFTGTSVVGLGALTLTANSTFNFDALSTGGRGTFVFSSLIPTAGVLTILNWGSNAFAPTNVSGTDGIDDRLIFNQDQATNLASFSFNGVSATEIALGGGFFEIVPLPEPSTWVAGGLVLASLLVSQRRRLSRLVGARKL